MGFGNVSLPFILKEHLSYTQVGFLAWASYPFAFKFLWAPFIDKVIPISLTLFSTQSLGFQILNPGLPLASSSPLPASPL